MLATAEGLSLAAAPLFAGMAVLAAVAGDGRPDAICGASPAGFWLAGMVPMYLLMSAVHLAPWMRRYGRPAATARTGGHPPRTG
ncbi:hypothetical protein [Allostella humosa]|nr:hypothetical protein [Stella humosa]